MTNEHTSRMHVETPEELRARAAEMENQAARGALYTPDGRQMTGVPVELTRPKMRRWAPAAAPEAPQGSEAMAAKIVELEQRIARLESARRFGMMADAMAAKGE